jgi:cytochrome c556
MIELHNRGGWVVVAGSAVFLGALASTQCSGRAAPPPSKPPVIQLIGDNPWTPVVSVKELMSGMIDPLADNIFDAVQSEVSAKGIVDIRPRTDEDWEKVRIGAVTLAEGIYLLKIPRPFTPPGDVNHSTGENPPELSPTQIKEKVDKDPVLWDAKIQALRNAALAVLEVVTKKDADALFEAGGNLDEACEACHLEYWYPGDKKAVDEFKNGKVTHVKPGRAK